MTETERCLLLCTSYPTYSEKHGPTVCMAGMTEEGEFRRLYPMPFDVFAEKEDMRKRQWIEYEIREEGDYRKESYKIVPESVKTLEEEDYKSIGEICRENKVSSIEKLNKMQEADDTSLGIVEPSEIQSLSIDYSDEREEMLDEYNGGINIVPCHTRYEFFCGDGCVSECDLEGGTHNIMCEDIELGTAYWNFKRNYPTEEEAEEKLKEKFLDWMVENRDVYFLMGTHYRFQTWMVISILYPPEMPSGSVFDY